MKYALLILFSLFISASVFSQDDTTETSLVNWIELSKAETLFAQNPKPILIDVYTDWCSWCKHMMKTTYSNPNIAGFINNNFYPVKFNSEKTDSVTFGGQVYLKQGKTNKLAINLLNGRLSYPSTVFITRSGQKFIMPGYKSVAQIEPYLVYASEDLSNFISLEEYIISHMINYPNNFVEDLKKIPDTLKPDTSGVSNWLKFNEAFDKAKIEPRKYLLFSNVSWCFSCKVMKNITFSDSIIASEINNNFYLINFDAATTDTIKVDTNQYVSLGQGQPNQLAMELFQGKFFFPSIIILDENFTPLTVVNGYFSAPKLESILVFFSSNAWKTQTYQDFMTTFETKR
ncbi:MAG: DUF255 domain-containing protein [Bacteroidales bacterium]|nr:DUF255 domain-containing protein [Bacteroidales bacterium]